MKPLKKDRENWSFHRVLNEVKDYYFEKIFPYEDESERLSEKDFIARELRIEEITLEVLARDVASYVLNGGSLTDDETKIRDLPFDRRFRGYLANQRAKGISIDYADLMKQVVEYYFSNIAPTVEEKDRFYVMALNDITSNGNSLFYFYYSADKIYEYTGCFPL